jgi:hypothetical protein
MVAVLKFFLKIYTFIVYELDLFECFLIVPVLLFLICTSYLIGGIIWLFKKLVAQDKKYKIRVLRFLEKLFLINEACFFILSYIFLVLLINNALRVYNQ